MKKMRIGLLSVMLIGMLAAFATPKPLAVTYHKKAIGSGNCQATTCTPTVTTACSETNIEYFESDANNETPCFKKRVLYLP
jgi:hypothetical protein